MEVKTTLEVAAVGDLHYGSGQPVPPLSDLAADADVLVLCGDLTDHGLPEEAQQMAKELASVHVPVLAVLGNHDYESGREDEVRHILADARVTVLDGEACEIKGVGFAGAKGFAGGFGRGTLQSWGEKAVKSFVQEAIDETLKLEKALARLRTKQIVAILHYSPVQSTVEGEPLEIFPFLGSSRLEEPINRYSVAATFHGHAHRGTYEGKTQAGRTVYNVSLPLMRKQFPGKPPVCRISLPLTEDPNAPTVQDPH
jgi:Icc-related predicted phosphoesterase